MGSLERLFKHTFIYGLATVLPRLLTALLTWLLTKYLDAESDFGQVSILFTYIVFLNVMLTYGMETAFFRFYSGEHQSKNTLQSSLWTVAITTVLFVVLGFVFLGEIAQFTQLSSNYWRWVIMLVAFDTLTVIPFAHIRAHNKSTRYTYIKLFNVLVSVGMSAAFLIATQKMTTTFTSLPKDKIELYLIAFCIASFATFCAVAKPYFTRFYIDLTLVKKMLSYSWPILIAGLAFAINEAFDKELLRWLLPLNETDALQEVGVYTACYRLAIGMNLFAVAFRIGIEPFFFSQAKQKNAAVQYALITKVFVALGAILMLVYIVLLDVIKPLLVAKPSYWVAMDITPIVIFAFFFFGIYQTLSVWYKVTDRTRYGAYISLIGAGVTIAINVMLIPTLGYKASAMATCAAYGIMLVISYLWGRKHYKIPYDLKNSLAYISMSVLFSCLFFYFFRSYFGIGSWQSYLVGFVLISILLIFVRFRESKLIKELLKR